MSTSCDLECAGAHNRSCGELRHLFDCGELDHFGCGCAGCCDEILGAALLASVPALIAIPWKPHTSQAHTHALLSDIARAMGQNKL